MEKPLIVGHVVNEEVYIKASSVGAILDWAADGIGSNHPGVKLVRHLQKMFDGAASQIASETASADLPNPSSN